MSVIVRLTMVVLCTQCTLIVATNVRSGEVKCFVSNGVAGRGGWTLRELLRVAFGRWKIDAVFLGVAAGAVSTVT